MGSRIVATGRAVPRTALTNKDLERYMETSDEWIRSRTGIGQRYLMRQGESLAQIAIDASRTALEPRRTQARRSRRDHRRHSFLRIRLPLLRLPDSARPRHLVDSRLRRRRRLLRLRVCGSSRRRTDARRRLQARTRSRRRRALDDGRLERSPHRSSVRRRRGRVRDGHRSRQSRRAVESAAIRRRTLDSALSPLDWNPQHYRLRSPPVSRRRDSDEGSRAFQNRRQEHGRRQPPRRRARPASSSKRSICSCRIRRTCG